MLRQRYQLISEASGDQEECLSKLLSYIFSDQYIFIDKSFRKLITSDHKGYIHVDELVKNKLVGNFFRNNSIENTNEKHYYLRGAAQSRCPELHYNLARIRRVVPFNVKKFKAMRPISLEKIQRPLLIEEVRDYFGQHVFSLNQSIQRKSKDDIIVYSQSYREQMANIKNRSPPFTILSFEELYRQFDLTERLSQRKLIGLHKPMQPPKRHYHSSSKSKRHGSRGQAHDMLSQEHRIMLGGMERDNNDEFFKLGKQPNPELNMLLRDLVQAEVMSRQ